MTAVTAEASSFRDPSGHVFEAEGRIFRTVTGTAVMDYEFVKETGLLRRLVEEGLVVGAEEVDRSVLGQVAASARYVLEHPRLPFVSYPYEWTFSALKAAAHLQLNLHLEALERGVTLSDASAYNVQFRGAHPIFIDHLSFRRYRDGEFWVGHRQFCEQFLNPLLLRALLGVPHNSWYRGCLEGIATADLSCVLPWRRKISWNVLSHVVLQAKLQRAANDGRAQNLAELRDRRLPLATFKRMLVGLRDWIAKLKPADTGDTVWAEYSQANTYSLAEADKKRCFIKEFATQTKPRLAWDLGCNTGDYSEAALEGGAESVIGFDFDHGALEIAFARAGSKDLALLPLYLDAANPSPNQGWAEAERRGLKARATANAVLALAFVHHLAIGRNEPLRQVVAWLTDLTPAGVIEFVPKTDPTVVQMLQLREDVFEDYTEENFLEAIQRRAPIVKRETFASGERSLIWFDRNGRH